MKIEPVIGRIIIYPVKLLDGTGLEKAMITEGGCLLHDREYAVRDKEGILLQAKQIFWFILCVPRQTWRSNTYLSGTR